jgi:hypothetical protein
MTWDQLLEATVLIFELPQPADLRHVQPAVVILPAVERGLGNTHLSADLRHRRTTFGLL